MRFCFLIFLFVFSNVWAVENTHFYPNSEARLSEENQTKDFKYPGYCQIELINNSYSTVKVFGVYDDDVELEPFVIYPHEYPHYISLYYYGYCHYGMHLYVETLLGYRVYSGYTRRYDTVYISSYMFDSKPKISVKVASKANDSK